MRKYIAIWLTVVLVAVAGIAYGQSGLVPPNTVQAGPPGGVSKGFMRPRALVPNDLPATTVTGGTTARKDKDRRDNFIEAPDIGVDCTNTNDSTTAIQNWVNANLNGGHLRFPTGCRFFTTSTVVVTDGDNITIDGGTNQGSDPIIQWNWKGTNGGAACATTYSSCVYVLDFEHTDHPTVQNIQFNSLGGSNCPDGFLKFDGNPGAHIGTVGHIYQVSLGNGSGCNNPNFIGIAIAPTATGNHENYIVRDSAVFCSSSIINPIVYDGVTNGTTTVTSASNPFTSGMVGQRIRLSYDNNTDPHGTPPSRGYFDTTIAGFTSSRTVTLAAAVPFSVNPVTIAVGQSYGTAYRNGPSQNALQQTFQNVQYSNCQIGAMVAGGGVQISQLNGGSSDVGAYFDGFIAQNSTIDYYASESDYVAISQRPGSGSPFEISNARLSNGRQAGNGFIQLGGLAGTILRNTLVEFGFGNTNSVLIGPFPGVGVGALGTITGGSGYVDGTYTNVLLSTTTALPSTNFISANATVTVAGGSVTSVTITNQQFSGIGAVPGQVLSTSNSNLGGSGSGFSVPVTALVAPATIANVHGIDTFPRIVSINNDWQPGCCGQNITWARLGLDQMINPPAIQIGDQVADIPNNLPGNNRLPCTSANLSCVLVDAYVDQIAHNQSYGVGVQVNMGASIVASGDQIAFRATGQPSLPSSDVSHGGGGTTFTAFQAYPETLASGGTTQTMFDAAWGAVVPLVVGVGNFYGFHAESPNLTGAGGSTLPAMYGFACDKQKTDAKILASWCFYNADPADPNYFAGPVITAPTTVASLPTCNAGTQGARMFVTDQNTAIAYHGAVTGGGSNKQGVTCDGSAWYQD